MVIQFLSLRDCSVCWSIGALMWGKKGGSPNHFLIGWIRVWIQFRIRIPIQIRMRISVHKFPQECSGASGRLGPSGGGPALLRMLQAALGLYLLVRNHIA